MNKMNTMRVRVMEYVYYFLIKSYNLMEDLWMIPRGNTYF